MKKSASGEFKTFIEEHLLRLLGIHHKKGDDTVKSNGSGKKSDLVVQEGDYVYFSTYTETPYKAKCNRSLTKDDLSVAKNIVTAFFRVSEYSMDTGRSIRKYVSDVQRKKNYEMAVQKGICTWIVGHANDAVEKLLDVLEKWSVQTYEGKKVTYSFVIKTHSGDGGQNTPKSSFGNFIDFIDDDFSAVFTDCIHSAIELDENCEFCRYLSVSEGDEVERYTLSKRLPIRFAPIIQKYVIGSAVGIFLLNNGDIILSKNREIRFVKRNLKWLNLSYEAFKNAFNSFESDNKKGNSLIEDIYASTLDVSFSHTGGIIAVVENISDLITCQDDGYPILSEFDYLESTLNKRLLGQIIKREKMPPNPTEAYLQKIDWREVKKRALKRNALDCLADGREFAKLDRKLRAELIALDGACILTTTGKPCAFGAIIKNDSGSSGGGRGAAAKKLSKWGIAIKISADGYIELYKEGQAIYTIK